MMGQVVKVALAATAASAVVAAGLAASAVAAPASQSMTRAPEAASAVIPAQVGIYFGYGGPNRPYYGYRPYYRPYGGYYGGYYAPPPPPPPPVTYYETRPYVARPSYRGGDPDAVARCASRFRSFNVHTGTYTTYDGEERLCPYLR